MLSRLSLFLSAFAQDSRYSARLLRKSPGFTTVVVTILAVGIAASTSIFSALDSVLFRPLPYPTPERMVQIAETVSDGRVNSVSGGAFKDWRDQSTQLEAIALVHGITQNLRTNGEVDRLNGLEVTHQFLDVLGKPPLRGRGFVAEDEIVGGNNHVVVLTEELWRSRFGADESLVGRTLILDDVPRQVIGILPAGAWLFSAPQFFIPAVLDPAIGDRAVRFSHWADVYARMKPGVSPQQLDTELKAIKQRLASEYPPFKQTWGVRVLPLHLTLAANPRPVMLTLVAAVALVLLIACANVANLLLARASQRRREISLRAALGASGSRLARQTLTESLLLAAIGGALGIVLSLWGVEAVARLSADLLPQAMAPKLDVRVLAMALVLTMGTGLLFGLLPAWHARHPDLNEALKSGAHSTSPRRRNFSQSVLVVTELALTLMLLAAAGLLMRSLVNTTAVNAGINLDHVLTFDVSLPDTRYPSNESRSAFITQALERFAAVPGVVAVGSTIESPFVGGSYGEYISRRDQPETRFGKGGRVNFVAGDYFAAMGMQLVRGRALTSADFQSTAARVAVVNQTLANTYFPGEEAVGKFLNTSGAIQEAEIIGVVADARTLRLEREPGPVIYGSHALQPTRVAFVVRTAAGNPLVLTNAMREALAQVAPGIPMADTRSLADAMRESLGQRRLVLYLVGGFSVGALILACVGLYGVMSYSVATRRRELSVRIALGAARRNIIGLILGDGGRLTVIGLVVGLAATAAASRLIASQLFGVKSYDPIVLGSAALLLGIIALVACYLPARRATKVNPIDALRAE